MFASELRNKSVVELQEPDGTSPAEVSEMDYVAKTLSDFAEMMGII